LAHLFVGSGSISPRPAFSPDGCTLAVSTEKGTLLHEIGGLREQSFVALQPQPIRSVALPLDGRALACLSRSVWREEFGDVTVWPLAEQPVTAPTLRHTFLGYAEGQYSVAFQPNSLAFQPRNQLLAFGTTWQLLLWDAAAGRDFAVPGVQDPLKMLLSFALDGRLWGGCRRFP
jgi:hypothetical protein